MTFFQNLAAFPIHRSLDEGDGTKRLLFAILLSVVFSLSISMPNPWLMATCMLVPAYFLITRILWMNGSLKSK